jgi:hypothetical protein
VREHESQPIPLPQCRCDQRNLASDQMWVIERPPPRLRLNGEIKRRTEVVGIFPNEAAITRLIGAILMEQSDEWAIQRARYMTLETMAPVSDNPIVMISAVPGA